MLFRSNSEPKPRFAYAVEHGTYCGEFFVFIESDKDNNYFISLPKNDIRIVTKENFEKGLKEKVIVFVQVIPRNIFKTCKKQYQYCRKKNENINNRHK